MGAEFTPEHIDTLRQTYGGRMSESETEFLCSVQAFIEGAIRDSLGFVAVMQVLQQQIRGLGRFQFDLDDGARSRGSSPLSTPAGSEAIRPTNGGPCREGRGRVPARHSGHD